MIMHVINKERGWAYRRNTWDVAQAQTRRQRQVHIFDGIGHHISVNTEDVT